MAMGEENKNQDLEEEEEKEPFLLSTSSSLSKIPFRPRKIRKISTSAAATDEEKPSLSPTSPSLAVLLPRPLTADGELFAALHHLRLAEPLLSPVIDTHPPPSLSSPPPSPFLSLARSILYQQLATKAAASIYQRFLSLACPQNQNQEQESLLPSSVLALSPARLRQIGVSARKSSYLHDLAGKFQAGILTDDAILSMDDRSLSSLLTMVKGIGPWSVHMFLIFSLHRPDVLPAGDLGVRKGVQLLYGLEALPRPSEMERLCERWRPYRSVGAWYMWRLVESGGLPPAVAAAVDPLQAVPELA